MATWAVACRSVAASSMRSPTLDHFAVVLAPPHHVLRHRFVGLIRGNGGGLARESFERRRRRYLAIGNRSFDRLRPTRVLAGSAQSPPAPPLFSHQQANEQHGAKRVGALERHSQQPAQQHHGRGRPDRVTNAATRPRIGPSAPKHQRRDNQQHAQSAQHGRREGLAERTRGASSANEHAGQSHEREQGRGQTTAEPREHDVLEATSAKIAQRGRSVHAQCIPRSNVLRRATAWSARRFQFFPGRYRRTATVPPAASVSSLAR